MGAMDEFNEGVIKEFRANQGVVGGQMKGMPVLLITMTGAKTGRKITKPLVYSRDGDRIVIIASYAGAVHNPPWYHNLVANPDVTVELGGETFKAKAAVAPASDRQRLYDQQAKQMPIFTEYQKKTTRQIPVLLLTRI